eukprot:2314602-Rhodomonas_salina.1
MQENALLVQIVLRGALVPEPAAPPVSTQQPQRASGQSTSSPRTHSSSPPPPKDSAPARPNLTAPRSSPKRQPASPK